MEAQERAILLLNKYSFEYIKSVVNNMIITYRKDDNIESLNHWNEISAIIKEKVNGK